MPHDGQPIRNLVFCGGGVKGVAYVGAIEVLEERGILSGVKRVAGASAGAITAGLLAAGADAQSFTKLFRAISFPSFVREKCAWLSEPLRLHRHYGLHSGDPLVEWLSEAVGMLTLTSLGEKKPDVTLGELHRAALSGKPVRHFFGIGSNLTAQLPEVFSADTTPDVTLVQAMRASASFPVVFQPYLLGKSLYVDGGITWNYPIDLFDGDYTRRTRGRPAPEHTGDRTMGFALGAMGNVADVAPPHPVAIGDLQEFAQALIAFTLDESTRLHTSRHGAERTIVIDDLGVSTTDFDITSAKEDALIDSGRKATAAWLDAHASPVPSLPAS
jgi:NTE family protein